MNEPKQTKTVTKSSAETYRVREYIMKNDMNSNYL